MFISAFEAKICNKFVIRRLQKPLFSEKKEGIMKISMLYNIYFKNNLYLCSVIR